MLQPGHHLPAKIAAINRPCPSRHIGGIPILKAEDQGYVNLIIKDDLANTGGSRNNDGSRGGKRRIECCNDLHYTMVPTEFPTFACRTKVSGNVPGKYSPWR